MHSKQLLLLLSWLVIGSHVLSQEGVTPKRLSVLLSPALIPAAPTKLALQPGVQLRLYKWSLTAQVAVPVQKLSGNFASARYFRKSAELKRYFKQRRDWEEYLSAEIQYAQRSFTDTNGGNYFKGINEERYSYSSAHIQSPILTAVVKAGAEFVIHKKFFLDAFAGVGVRTIYTTYSDVKDDTLDPYGWFEINGPKSAYRYDRTFSKPHITVGFKFGYTLW